MRRACLPVLVASFVCSSVSLAATSIAYQAIDLSDITPGVDLWQYRYSVSGSFAQFFGFEILFDATKVASLDETPAAPGVDWFVSTIQPLPGVPADGTYSALALVSDASLASPFEVSFVRNGPDLPGAQSFHVLDDTFGRIEPGTTVPIPEPQTYALMGAGLLLLIARLRARRVR